MKGLLVSLPLHQAFNPFRVDIVSSFELGACVAGLDSHGSCVNFDLLVLVLNRGGKECFFVCFLSCGELFTCVAIVRLHLAHRHEFLGGFLQLAEGHIGLTFPVVALDILRVQLNAVASVVKRNAGVLHAQIGQRSVAVVDRLRLIGDLAEYGFGVPLD